MKTFKFSLVLRTRENTDVFITLDDNIYGIHSKRVNILYVLLKQKATHCFITRFISVFYIIQGRSFYSATIALALLRSTFILI